MNERISALMDGELDDRAAGELIEAIGRDREALTAWSVYHLISDAMRENQPLPRAPVVPLQSRRWVVALPIAASVAAVTFVGWLAFSPQPAPQAPIAQAPAPTPVAAAPIAPALIPLPSTAADYLLAHEGVSPRAFQGMAPYVRSVSAEVREARR